MVFKNLNLEKNMGKGKNETPEQREKRLAYNREWNRIHRKEERTKRRERYYKWQRDGQITEYQINRLNVLDRMGGKCVFCNETDVSVLTIDHVMNDGAKDRKTSKNLYLRLSKEPKIPPDRYQILCFYCNHKKRIFGDDPAKWPPPRTVQEQICFVNGKIRTAKKNKNG